MESTKAELENLANLASKLSQMGSLEIARIAGIIDGILISKQIENSKE